MRHYYPFNICALLLLILGTTTSLTGQKDSVRTMELKPVFVAETKPNFATTSRNITALTLTEMRELGAQTLSEAMAGLPGVGQFTTGAVSKPVIRGLYGNRLQVNMGGQRLEDQQWEDEHGLGLSDIGIERVEVIKGPAALLYGSEAMGGVVHIVDEAFAAAGQTRQNLNLRLFSNTYGTGLDYGIKTGREKHRFVFRGGLESHADYSDGNGQRVPNTRFAMYNFKAGYLVQKNRWTSENRLLVSQNQFGFLKDTAEVAEAASEPRLSREFEEEHQSIFLTLLSSKNSLEINEKTRLKWIVGLQSNHREEVEGEEESDLDLWLLTAQ